MAKFAGKIGFASFEETAPGVQTEKIVERAYYGDIVKNMNKWVPTDHINDDIQVHNEISIVADPYAFDNFFSIRYVTWMGTRWKAQNVEVQSPRLVISMGGMYNGATPSTTDNP